MKKIKCSPYNLHLSWCNFAIKSYFMIKIWQFKKNLIEMIQILKAYLQLLYKI